MTDICFIHRAGNPKSDFVGSVITDNYFVFDYQKKQVGGMLYSAFRASLILPKAKAYLVEGGLGFWVAYFRKIFCPSTKIVVMAVDPLFNWRRRSLFKNLFFKFIFRSIDFVLPVSLLVERDWRYYNKTVPSQIVHHYIETALFESLAPDYAQKNILFMIHRPEETAATKGLDIVLDIFRRVVGRDPDWQLYIIGQNTEKLKFTEASVHSLGSQPPQNYFTSCPILLAPARYESFSLAATEAGLAGVVPLISDTVGAEEFLRMAAPDLIFPYTRPADFADKILSYHFLPLGEKQALGAKLRQAARSFSRERSLREMTLAWDKVKLILNL